MRIFLGLREVTGTYRNLKLGFERLGIPCTFIDLLDHDFKYGGNDNGLLVRWMLWCKRKGGLFRLLESVLLRRLLFVWALLTHDVFIFASTTSFFRDYSDQAILKFFGKRIIHQFHGTDCRPPYINGAIVNDTDITTDELVRRTRHLKKTLRTVEKYADVLINIPPQAHFHERPYVNRLWLGRPLEMVHPPPAEREPGPVRVLHCPSRLRSKGTLEIRQAIENLQAKNLAQKTLEVESLDAKIPDFEFIEISGQPNAVIMDALARCDFVVDQLYSDYPLPGLATEAAWFGKPTVVGGYAQSLWAEALPEDKMPPSLYCRPEDLERALARMIADSAYRERLGRAARHFVEENWRLEQVARRYLQIIHGDYPAGWVCDPGELRYVHGCALPEDRAREGIRAVVRTAGESALQLDDKPALRQEFIIFADLYKHFPA